MLGSKPKKGPRDERRTDDEVGNESSTVRGNRNDYGLCEYREQVAVSRHNKQQSQRGDGHDQK